MTKVDTRRRSREQMTSMSQQQTMDDNYHYPSSIFSVQRFSLNSFERTVAKKSHGRKPDPSFSKKKKSSDIILLQSTLKKTGRKCSDVDLSMLNSHFEKYIEAVNLVLSEVYSRPGHAQKLGEELSKSGLHGHATLRSVPFLRWKIDNKFGILVYERMFRNVLETAARIIHSDYTRRKLVMTALEVLGENREQLRRLLSNKRIPADLIRNIKDANGQKNFTKFYYALSACKQVRHELDDFLLDSNLVKASPTERAGRRGRKRQRVRFSIKATSSQSAVIVEQASKKLSEWNCQGFPFTVPRFKKKTNEFAGSTENSTTQGYWFSEDPSRPDEIILFIKTPPGITQSEPVPGSPYRNQTLRFRFLNWLPRKALRSRKKAAEAMKEGNMERAQKLAFRAAQFEDMSKQILNTIKLQNLTRELNALRARKEGNLSTIQQIKTDIRRLRDARTSAPPTLRVVGTKVILLINFLPPDKSVLTSSLFGIERNKSAGVDRGLRYPVVVSIQNHDGSYHEKKIGLDMLYQKRERLRQQARKLTSQVARMHNNWERKHQGLQPPSLISKKEREMESVWRKVRRLDAEISHQVASETTWFCELHGVETIYFENLKTFQGRGGMGTHSWNLSTNLWGRIVAGVMYRRKFLGHKEGGILMVNPAWTSQKCHQCGEMGIRVERSDTRKELQGGEYFYCQSCGLSIHADINAARNILEGQKAMPSAISGRISRH